MINQSIVGRRSDPVVYEIERGAIRRFAEAIGATDAVHFDQAAARRAGYPDIVAPTTFAISLRAVGLRESLDLDLSRLLHGEQELKFERPIVAGDRLTVTGEVADVGEKRGKSGVMDVVVVATRGADATGAPVFEARTTLLIRR